MPAPAPRPTTLSAVVPVLALLLGFTFSIALQRYDARSGAVVAEAEV